MAHVRGLTIKTRSMALRIIRRLLVARFGDGPFDIVEINPEFVRGFFAQQAELYSKPASVSLVVTSLRGYFRYRASRGDLVHGLIGAVSYPANWKLSSLLKTLTAKEVTRLVGAMGQPGPAMRRADAILRCALDLRLRSCEVARLNRDDIDWRAGTVTLRQSKGLRQDVMPLLAQSSCAILHLATSPSAPIVYARPSARRMAVPGCLTRARTCCATRWPTGCWPVALRSRRWPTCFATAR